MKKLLILLFGAVIGITPLLAVPCGSPSDYSVIIVGDGNPGSNPGTTPNPDPIPEPEPTTYMNLTQKTTVSGNEGDSIQVGKKAKIKVKICAENGDTADARQESGKRTDTIYLVKIGDGDLVEFAKDETKDSNLKQGECHTESATYVIPDLAGQTITFKTVIDAGGNKAGGEIDEIIETDNDKKKSFNIIAKALPAFCANLPTLKNKIIALEQKVAYNLQKETEHKDSEKTWKRKYNEHTSKAKEYIAKYDRNKAKYNKAKGEKKKKYKRKYKKAKENAKKYEKKAKKAKKAYKKADRRKDKRKAKKEAAQKQLNKKQSLLNSRQGQCQA